MGWFGGIISLAGGAVKLINKFVPSREEKAGKAMAERDQLERNADARKKMDDVESSDESDTVDRLRDGDF